MSEFIYPDEDVALAYCQGHGFVVRDAGALASALVRPSHIIYGTEVYPRLVDKGAVILDGISRSHPLLDGNKRLAWAMTSAFFEVNGYILTATAQEIDDFVRQVAGDHMPPRDIALWLHDHAEPMDEELSLAYEADPFSRATLRVAGDVPKRVGRRRREK